MTFQPIVPISGLTGWTFLQNTLTRQTEAYNNAPSVTRDTDYFAQNIGDIDSAEALVADRRLLRVALGAFGLQDDINSRALIQKVLEDGTSADDALANRLSDDRYKQLSQAFGFGEFTGARTRWEGFADEINALYRRRSFEVAVGDQDQTMRLALNAKRELAEIAGRDETENTKWFSIMGVQPLRQVFETVLGLPSGFGQLDLDRQLEEFKSRASSQLGLSELEDLTDSEVLDDLIERFVLRDQISTNDSLSAGSIALSILQSA